MHIHIAVVTKSYINTEKVIWNLNMCVRYWKCVCVCVCVCEVFKHGAPDISVAELWVLGASQQELDTVNNEWYPCWEGNGRVCSGADGAWADETWDRPRGTVGPYSDADQIHTHSKVAFGCLCRQLPQSIHMQVQLSIKGLGKPCESCIDGWFFKWQEEQTTPLATDLTLHPLQI